MYQSFLIKYGEIAIKGKNRHLFEDALVSHLSHALKPVEGEFDIWKEQGRIYVDAKGSYDYDHAISAMAKGFGVVGVCPMVQVEDEGYDRLVEDVIAHLKETYGDKEMTFKVMARRARKNYPLNL